MNASASQAESSCPRILVGERCVPMFGSALLVGRHPGNDLVLDHDSISCWHSVIKKTADGFLLADMGSTNGSYLNGEAVSDAVNLTSHDQILFGAVEAFFIVPEIAPTWELVAPPPPYQNSNGTGDAPLSFSWWPRNRVASWISAAVLGLIFIFNAPVSLFAALFAMLLIYLPLTGVRYLKYCCLRSMNRLPVQKAQSAQGTLWRPIITGLAACSVVALILVLAAISGTNSEREQVKRYKEANEAAYDQHNSLSNVAGVGLRSGIHAYNGDYFTPVTESLSHWEQSKAYQAEVEAANQRDAYLASTRENDSSVIGIALLLLSPAFLYVVWKFLSWTRILSAPTAAFFLGGVGACMGQSSGLYLAPGWESTKSGGSEAMKEMASLLSPFAMPTRNLNAAPDLEIYQGVTYLMPVVEAHQKLGLPRSTPVKNKLTNSAFPRDSFFYYVFDGTFDSGYNKLILVTDLANQTVAIQLLAESPRKDMLSNIRSSSDWGFYNFIFKSEKGHHTFVDQS